MLASVLFYLCMITSRTQHEEQEKHGTQDTPEVGSDAEEKKPCPIDRLHLGHFPGRLTFICCIIVLFCVSCNLSRNLYLPCFLYFKDQPPIYSHVSMRMFYNYPTCLVLLIINTCMCMHYNMLRFDIYIFMCDGESNDR